MRRVIQTLRRYCCTLCATQPPLTSLPAVPLKSIRSKSDLAINGAPPAFAEPLHVGRPNIGNRGLFLQKVGEILDNHWLTNNGPMVQEFERRIAEYLGVRHCVAMCNGTLAL
ncbi:MAG: DegT/DnrJ/EryC1/StrS family aminotransferase, partial [Proteobacteria bacterium]|nr:DegT/DnrJ/EryC1/StrS family aminotransferase [Pseudomonadota bacterium]